MLKHATDSLISNTNKVMLKIIQNRINTIAEEQACFILARSTGENLLNCCILV